MKKMRIVAAVAVAVSSLMSVGAVQAIAIHADYAGSYSYTDLGSVPGLPASYGGLTFSPTDPNKIHIGGAANTSRGLIYEVSVVRDAQGHITGFSGSAAPLAMYGAFNDGGVTYGPGGVLFLARYPSNEIGQVKPGSVVEDRIISGLSIGIPGDGSIAALNFVPSGFAGASRMKVVTYGGGSWYDVVYTPDVSGTYDLAATQIDLDLSTPAIIDKLPGGPEGFVYIAAGNPLFGSDSILVAEWSAGKIASYVLDGEGNPLLSSRKDFFTDLAGAEGAVIDPLTGDFLFSTFGGGDRVILVQGFTIVPGDPSGRVPIPGTLLLTLAGLCGLGLTRGRVAIS